MYMNYDPIAFTIEGFQSWKKVRDGKGCAFLSHMGKDSDSFHKNATIVYESKLQLKQFDGLHFKVVLLEVMMKALIQSILAFLVRVKKAIREEINDSKFCIIVDEARDESKKEQMAIVLRFVDKDGFIRERFFGLVHVSDTKASTLQKGIYSVLSNHNLDIQNIRGQGYVVQVICEVLMNIIDEGKSLQAGDADSAYESMTSYQFVFILHLMEELMENTNELCLALQSQSQDILNSMSLSSTKAFIQKLRDDGCDTLFAKVNSFCEACNIDIPDMNARYVGRGGRARHQQDDWAVQHYYQVDIFYAAIDSQLQELNNRFNEHAVELLILSSALDPSEISKCFKIDAICQLVEKFYPHDFADHEKLQLKKQLEFFEYDVVKDQEFKSISTISDLSQWLVRTKRSTRYPLVYRVIVLVLTLPVSTTTTERSFYAMRIVKTRLCN
ncbi:uncharacterized protein LOC133744806 [Rosa rugosa]|uniref:uncharacterized protein LOC133744806 n=1 Tax=Rosa rugosa TaxID=74645 RepID=UPI002B402303|nr:uncharacterized protein LOC133744806 [Rosa rugosa]